MKSRSGTEGWGACETFEVDGTRLEELTKVAEAVGEKFTMVEVDNYNTMQYNIDTFRRIAAHMEKQEKRLSKLDTPLFNFTKRCRELAEIFLNLQNKCKEWRVVFFTLDSVRDDPDSEEYWAYLERICSNSVGHICNLLWSSKARVR